MHSIGVSVHTTGRMHKILLRMHTAGCMHSISLEKKDRVCISRSLCHSDACPVTDYSAPVVPQQEKFLAPSLCTTAKVNCEGRRFPKQDS